MSAVALVDVEAFDILKEVMEDEIKDLVQLYITDSENRFSDLSYAVELKNAEKIRELAHSFKGASANLAATELAEMCFKLEAMGIAKNLVGSNELLDEIRQEYFQVKDYLLTQI